MKKITQRSSFNVPSQNRLRIPHKESSCLTDKRRPNAAPDALTALRRTPRVGEVEQSMTGAGQMIEVTTALRVSNKNSLKRRAGAYRSSREKKHPIDVSRLYYPKDKAARTWTSKYV
jgi:hypothetical protein